MTIESIKLWHKRARPEPTAKDFNVQLGCHLEEIVEMLDTMVFATPTGEMLGAHTLARSALETLSQQLKRGVAHAAVFNREGFLDSAADQIVTSVGVGHCAGMQTAEAVERVSRSNWTKTVDGDFIRDANGKIAKPATYAAPDLSGLF
jgi:hypothetical protein